MSFDQQRPLANQRPGAMTMVMQAATPAATGPRELRIGRVENGAITDDRQYRTALSYGRSERATLMIPHATESCAPLFERSAAGTFTLLVPAGARGRLALAAGVIDLAEVAGTSIPIDASARGKLVLGETTLLFQLMPAASVPLRPRLSSAARGGFLSMIDWRFTSYVMASLCAHMFFVAWLDSADFAVDAMAMMLPEQVTRLAIEMPDPPPVPDDERVDMVQPTDDTIARNDDVVQPTHPSQPSHDRATPSERPLNTENTPRIAAEAARSAEQLLLGALGGETDGPIAQLLVGAATENAQALLDDVNGGVRIASGPAGVLHSRPGGGTSGETGTLGESLAAGGPGATAQRDEGLHQPTEVRVIPSMSEPDLPIQRSGDRDPDDVIRMLRARRLAFQACYEQRTRRNPDLHGKIAAIFTISEMGTVSDVQITENRTDDELLGVCIAATFQRVRFGESVGAGDSTFAHAFVFAPQN